MWVIKMNCKNSNTQNKKKGESLSAYVYNTIKKKIIDGELAPGDTLMDRTLAAELGVSRTPVRDALKKLDQEGWVLWTEHKGITVSEVNKEDEHQLYLLRNMIEPYAVKMIITDKRPQILAGMLVEYLDNMERVRNNYTEFMKMDMQFHTVIIKFLGLTKLLPLWNNICDDMTRIVVQSVHHRRNPADVLKEHKVLIDAFWNADLDAALACINDHCRRIMEEYDKD